MVEISIRSAVLGDDTVISKYSLGGAAILAVLFVFGFAIIGLSDIITLPTRFYIGVLVVMFVAATLHSYFNNGLVVSIALASGPAVGYQVHLSLFQMSGPTRPSIVTALGVGIMYGLIIGISGYAAGLLISRFK